MPTLGWLREFALDADKIMTVLALTLTLYKGAEHYLSKKEMMIIVLRHGGADFKFSDDGILKLYYEGDDSTEDGISIDEVSLRSPMYRGASDSSDSSASSSSSNSSSSLIKFDVFIFFSLSYAPCFQEQWLEKSP